MAVAKLGSGEDDGTGTGAGIHESDMRPVVLPTGTVHHLYKDEVDPFNDRMTRYMEDNVFVNHADLNDFDRLLIFEALVLRWSNWLARGANYWGDKIDEKQMQVQVKNLSMEIREIKQSLTIDKSSRDKQKAVDDVAEYIKRLQFRAKHFGVKRNREFAMMMEYFMELRAKIGLYERCDERDRQEQNANLEDIYKWLVEECFPALDELDRKFRQEHPDDVSGPEAAALGGGQRLWEM